MLLISGNYSLFLMYVTDVLESSRHPRHSGGGTHSAEWTAWLQGTNFHVRLGYLAVGDYVVETSYLYYVVLLQTTYQPAKGATQEVFCPFAGVYEELKVFAEDVAKCVFQVTSIF